MQDRTDKGINIEKLKVLYYSATSFLIIFSIGFIGFYKLNSSALDSLYLTIQLTLVQATYPISEYPWSVKLAAFFLPLYPAATLLSLLVSAMGLQLSLIKHQFKPRTHVFMGAGRLSASLIRTINERDIKQKILAVDINIQQKYASRVSKFANTLIVQHDINNNNALRKLNLSRTKFIYIFTGNDEQNIEISKKIILILNRTYINPPHLIINIESSDLLHIVSEEKIFREYQYKGGIYWFSAPEQSAREILKKHPLWIQSSLKSSIPLHVGVSSLNINSEALILQIVKQGISLNKTKIHVTVFGDSLKKFNQFLDAYPVLRALGNELEYGKIGTLAIIKFVEIGSRGITPKQIRQSHAKHENIPLQVLYLTEDSDYKSLTSTLQAKQALSSLDLNTRVVTRIAGSQYDQCQEAQEAISCNNQILTTTFWFHGVFDIFDEVETYPGETADTFGRLINAAYSAIGYGEPLNTNDPKFQEKFEFKLDQVLDSSTKEWQSHLRENFRSSSRQCGDHIFVKLRELGFKLERCCMGGDVSPQLIEEVTDAIERHLPSMLEMEHKRFVTERLIDGWLFHPSNDKNSKLNKTIIPFDELPKNEIIKDEVIIRAIPVILRQPIVKSRYKLSRL